MNEGGKPGGDDVLEIIHRLLTVYTSEKGLDEKEIGHSSPEEFMKWVRENRDDLLEEEDDNEIFDGLTPSEDVLEAIDTLIDNPLGFMQLLPIWHGLVLSFRDDPKHELESFQLLCLLKWRDGRAVPLSIYAPSFLSSEGSFNDSTICGLLLSQIQEITRHVISDGLDGLHDDKAEQYGGEDSFKSFMSLIQDCVRQLPVDQRVQSMNYLRLFQALASPPIPTDLRGQFREMLPKNHPNAPIDDPDVTTGGWD